MTAPVATTVGALLGATAAIVAALVTGWRQLKLERVRIEDAREKAVDESLSAAVQQLAIKMSAALHSMCWVTWLARTRGDRVTQKSLDEYDSEQHKALPEILGYLSTVAALDVDMHERLQPLVDEIFALDAYIGEAGLLIDEDRASMIRDLVSAYAAMVELERQLPKIVGDIAGNRVRGHTIPAAVGALTRPAATR